jgi:hypothetical protein
VKKISSLLTIFVLITLITHDVTVIQDSEERLQQASIVVPSSSPTIKRVARKVLKGNAVVNKKAN